MCSVLSTSMNSSPSPYLNVTRRQSIHRGTSSTSSCSTLTHSTGPMPSGKSNTSGSEKGAVVNQPRSRSQTTGGLRHSSIVVQIEKVGAKSKPSTTRFAPSRMPISSISEKSSSAAYRAKTSAAPGSTPMPTSASSPFSSHAVGSLELVVAELHAGLFVRIRRVRLGERHRHVEVGHSGLEAGVEDRRVEQRVDRVENDVRVRLPDESDDRVLPRGVDPVGREAAVVEPLHDLCRPRRVVVRERAVIEERAARRDPRERRPDTARSDDENPHGARFLHERPGL